MEGPEAVNWIRLSMDKFAPFKFQGALNVKPSSPWVRMGETVMLLAGSRFVPDDIYDDGPSNVNVRRFVVQLNVGLAKYKVSAPVGHVVDVAKAEEAITKDARAVKYNLFILLPPKIRTVRPLARLSGRV